uniref:Uncharacterized protein n=1 Tax=Lactuca sativa TaxID=4236 RepID=A0A9R1XCW5_LACSA|nr:hypothetical protein LSAT_V11C500282820 [Lactuca sativa]
MIQVNRCQPVLKIAQQITIQKLMTLNNSNNKYTNKALHIMTQYLILHNLLSLTRTLPMKKIQTSHTLDMQQGSGTMTEAAQSTRDVDLSPGQPLQSNQSVSLGVIGRRILTWVQLETTLMEAPCGDPIKLSASASSNCEQLGLLGTSWIRQHWDRYFIFFIYYQ